MTNLKEREAVVLVGGMGTRLRSAVPDLPKPMAPVNGRPFLEYLLDYWQGQGVGRFILCVGYKHDVIQSHFGRKYGRAEIDYSVETELLGTGGGLLLALPMLRSLEPFLALNGDTYFEVPLAEFQGHYTASGAQGALALVEKKGGQRYERIEMDRSHQITDFRFRDSPSQSPLINGGVYLLSREAFKDLGMPSGTKLSIEHDIFPRMIKARKRLYGFPFAGRFIDIGTPESYQEFAAMLPNK